MEKHSVIDDLLIHLNSMKKISFVPEYIDNLDIVNYEIIIKQYPNFKKERFDAFLILNTSPSSLEVYAGIKHFSNSDVEIKIFNNIAKIICEDFKDNTNYIVTIIDDYSNM